jgi:hypothetical protein
MRFLCGALSSSAIQDGVHDDGEHAEGNAAHGHALRTSCVGKQGVHVRECTLTAHSVPYGSAPCRASTPPVKHPAAALFTLSCLARTWPARTQCRETRHGEEAPKVSTVKVCAARTFSMAHSEPENSTPMVLNPLA